MGLVIQAQADALLPLAEAPVALPGQAPAEGVFAGVLASLAAQLDALPGIPETGAAPELGLPLPKPEDGDEATKNPLAALLALAAPLQQPTPPQPSTVDVATAGPGAATALAGVAPADTAAELGGTPAVMPGGREVPPVEAGEAPPAEPPAATGPSTLAPVATAAVTEAPPAAAPVASAPVAETAATLEAPAITARPAPPSADSERARPAEAGAPPDAAIPATSVVRPVGNAETTSEDAPGFGDRAEREPVVERPQPRASAQGIAHAAPNSAVGELRAAADAAADAPAAPAPGQAPASAPAPQQVEHVARAVLERVEAGGGEARIHLDPADLGEVTIHVQTDADGVRIEVRAERPEAMQLLRDHTHDLSSLLGERGLNLSDVNVGLGRGDSGQAWGQETRRQDRPATGEFASIFGTPETAALESHNRLRAAYNPDGAYIYRI